jgi:flagellar biosynthesis protein FlhB
MLARFVAERPHAASPTKLAQARARGDVAFTVDWAAAAVLTVACLAVNYQAAPLWAALQRLTRAALSGRVEPASAWLDPLVPWGVWLLVMPLAALLAVTLQRGFALRFISSDDEASQNSPSLTQRFGGVGISNWLKFGLLAVLLAAALRDALPGILDAWQRDASDLLGVMSRAGRSLGLRAVLGLFAIGLGDFFWQRYRRLRRLRMTARELADEQRELAGDPQMLGARRARARQSAALASLRELEAAQLVLVSASRAIALRYRPEADAVPVCWLKADGALATRLVAHAGSLGLPVLVDAPLVHALFRLEPSEAIPPEHYAAVATALTNVRPRPVSTS